MDDVLLFNMCLNPDRAHSLKLSVMKSLITESFALWCFNVFVDISDRVCIVDRNLMQHHASIIKLLRCFIF